MEIKNCNGKLKEYNIDDELVFEGEYINGEKKMEKGKNIINVN